LTLMPALLLALLMAVTAATANVAGFTLRAQGLNQRWQAAEAAGVPAASLAEARRELAAEQARRAGLLPYAVVSGAAFTDPFAAPEASANAAYGAALGGARQRAAAALARRDDAGGPNDAGQAARVVQLAGISRPADGDGLARRWTAEAAVLEAAREQLAAQAGGLANGLPADVVAGTAGLSDVISRAEQAGIGSASADAAVVDADVYLARPYPALLAAHQEVAARLRAETDRLAGRLDVQAKADALLAKDADLLQLVTQFGAGDELKGRLDQAGAGLTAARTARDEAGMDAAVAAVQRVDADLQAAAGGRLPTAGIPCESGAPAQLILIHLATQQLVAYENGCPMLRTPVTTGRSALPTGRGTFHIYYKAARYHMISPWPLGNPFYYPPTWVSNAMEFIGNGTFIHSADWQPDDSYGSGSQYGPYASHGCVHVIDGPLQQLYDWAAIGATVVVED
jgi:lipoprotein-anchoring transpeptidase ErfK/SrfK